MIYSHFKNIWTLARGLSYVEMVIVIPGTIFKKRVRVDSGGRARIAPDLPSLRHVVYRLRSVNALNGHGTSGGTYRENTKTTVCSERVTVSLARNVRTGTTTARVGKTAAMWVVDGAGWRRSEKAGNCRTHKRRVSRPPRHGHRYVVEHPGRVRVPYSWPRSSGFLHDRRISRGNVSVRTRDRKRPAAAVRTLRDKMSSRPEQPRCPMSRLWFAARAAFKRDIEHTGHGVRARHVTSVVIFEFVGSSRSAWRTTVVPFVLIFNSIFFSRGTRRNQAGACTTTISKDLSWPKSSNTFYCTFDRRRGQQLRLHKFLVEYKNNWFPLRGFCKNLSSEWNVVPCILYESWWKSFSIRWEDPIICVEFKL